MKDESDAPRAQGDESADRRWQGLEPPPLPGAPARPAVFPRGFWARIDFMLHHPEELAASLRADVALWPLVQIFFFISLAMAAVYGGVMGATDLLQGANMAMTDKLLLLLASAVKVPILYLVTLVIVLPPVYVSNAFVGARLKLRQMIASIMGAMALTTTILASMATVAAFFALTSRSYNFIKLLHVAIFAYAGLSGLEYLVKSMRSMLTTGPRKFPKGLLILWLVLYMFVGTQMAWVLRPFVGSPGMPFQLFRPRAGNFYESVFVSARDLFAED